MKKYISIILTLLMIISLSSCGKEKLQYYSEDIVTFLEKQEEDNEKVERESIDELSDIKDKINVEGKEICDFINKNYNLDWNYQPIDEVDLLGDSEAEDISSKSAEFLKEPNPHFLINQSKKNDEDVFEMELIHEIVRYIMHLNAVIHFKYNEITDKDGKIAYIGNYLEEVIWEEITLKYAEYKEFAKKRINNYKVESDYYPLVIYLEETELCIPKLTECILKDNFEKIKEVMNEKISEYGIDNQDISDPLTKWLSVFDESTILFNSDNWTLDKEKTYWSNFYEMIGFLNKICPEENRKEFLINLKEVTRKGVYSLGDILRGINKKFFQ